MGLLSAPLMVSKLDPGPVMVTSTLGQKGLSAAAMLITLPAGRLKVISAGLAPTPHATSPVPVFALAMASRSVHLPSPFTVVSSVELTVRGNAAATPDQHSAPRSAPPKTAFF